MRKIIIALIPALIFWFIFLIVILTVNYPKSLTQANFYQILAFFVPLYLALILTIRIVIKKIVINLIISLGLMILLILKALDSFNIVTAILTVLAIGFLISYFKDSSVSKPNLKKF